MWLLRYWLSPRKYTLKWKVHKYSKTVSCVTVSFAICLQLSANLSVQSNGFSQWRWYETHLVSLVTLVHITFYFVKDLMYWDTYDTRAACTSQSAPAPRCTLQGLTWASSDECVCPAHTSHCTRSNPTRASACMGWYLHYKTKNKIHYSGLVFSVHQSVTQ